MVLLTPLNNKLESSWDSTILKMYSTLSFKIINVDVQDSKTFSCISVSAVDAAAVNPNGIKTLLANGLITSFVNGNSVFKSYW